MTKSSGKRLYRACQRCRSRKTRCELQGSGGPNTPPCVSCLRSGVECILAGSRRGGNFRTRRENPRNSQQISDRLTSGRSGKNSPSNISTPGSDLGGESSLEQDEDVGFPFRNPADALNLLAQSDHVNSPSRLAEGASAEVVLGGCDKSRLATDQKPSSHKYELVQNGTISPDVLERLLGIFVVNYHPHCPIVPLWVFECRKERRIATSDDFLLSVVLTIASRDDMQFIEEHRNCWDYTQSLLLKVVLASPDTQTPRTVEALLLLAEWLPHIQTSHSGFSRNSDLAAEDATAWSLVGLAVRHAYLQRLDLAAFKTNQTSKTKQQTEHHQLIWAHVYIADRQISVRLGQSFWSRGPSLSSKFVAGDFPSLVIREKGSIQDYASALEANIELTQLLHNAHDILFSSQSRKLALVFAGDYNRYIEDFQKASYAWLSKWDAFSMPSKIKHTMRITYQYLCLYVNAFAFQAVLTRHSRKSQRRDPVESGGAPAVNLFYCGIMSSPDARYIFDAIAAALNILRLMGKLDPSTDMCFLPWRYYLYGVYAAVFLYKARRAGIYQSKEQQVKDDQAVTSFIEALADVSPNKLHIARRYGRMLSRFWQQERWTTQGSIGRFSSFHRTPP
ncbi:hypothetical protein BKA67DRAFT_637033 [Truncatella angustata]|uniref:Zn(2)-C6 fungal-type domain-containing protein n=1 Tax=Truncatella angustata TaxID=152316 RepID=A0A9P8UI72_9PEZI|nr:uncharacterized protein BKA67DRAFT_637033 [Truncatella angustata]KAH6652535.1 hypothetical protein BKA67DRAFT_637033 [Truncatella angustata]